MYERKKAHLMSRNQASPRRLGASIGGLPFLVLVGVVGTFWLRPLMTFGYGLINTLISPLLSLLS